MLHTNQQATEYIWEKFKQVLISESSISLIRDLEPLLKMKEHRPGNTGKKSQKIFEDKLQEKLRHLKTRYSDLDLNIP
jgi:hypothetical protein